MPIRFWGRKERQSPSAPEINPYARLDDLMLMDLLGRVAQLTGLLEGVAGALTDMVVFHQEVAHFASVIAETASLQHEWFDRGQTLLGEGHLGESAPKAGSLLAEAAQLSRNCAHRSVRIMEGVQNVAEMAEESILLLLHSCPGPAAESEQSQVPRTYQLAALAERTRQRSAEVISLLHQLGQNHDALRQMIHTCQDELAEEGGIVVQGQCPAALQEAWDRVSQIRSIAGALLELAARQARSMEQVPPVAETLQRDAAEIRRLVEALITEGTAATIT